MKKEGYYECSRGKFKLERSNSDLKPDGCPKYYYHLTDKVDWCKIENLVPLEGNGGGRGKNEPTNDRICVAPSIAHCIAAIPYYDPEVYFVYRTLKKVIGYWPYGVPDAHITRERWLINTTKFIWFATLSIRLFVANKNVDSNNFTAGSIWNLERQKKIRDEWTEALKNPPEKGLELVL
jgi:hypothetical protein